MCNLLRVRRHPPVDEAVNRMHVSPHREGSVCLIVSVCVCVSECTMKVVWAGWGGVIAVHYYNVNNAYNLHFLCEITLGC